MPIWAKAFVQSVRYRVEKRKKGMAMSISAKWRSDEPESWIH